MKAQRQSNIELLRILAMLGIIVLHFNHKEYGGGFLFVEMGSANSILLYFLEAIANSGVDLFLIISGFFLYKSHSSSLKKALDLIIQVMAYRVALYLLRVLFLGEAFSLKNAFFAFLPINYFIILYCTMYLLSPYINILLRGFNKEKFSFFLLLLFVLFAVWPTIFDIIQNLLDMKFVGIDTLGITGDQEGYSIVNFILCYCIGAYIRKLNDDNEPIKSPVLLLIICIVIQFIWPYTCAYLNMNYSAYNYNNPIVLIEAASIFILFLKLNMKPNRFINTAAKGAFSVFLLNIGLIEIFDLRPYITGSFIMLLICLVIVCIGIYFICLIVHLIYTSIYNKTLGAIFNKCISMRIE